MPVSSRRTKIAETWQPSPEDAVYADAHGIGDLAAVAEEFRDYHLSRGTLMLDWRAAWRTWCRNQKKWGRGAAAKAPLLNGEAESDPFGARAFAARCPYAKPGTLDGKTVPSVSGWDLVGVLVEVCEVARLTPDWRGDLAPVADWLRDGFDPEQIVDVIRASKPPREAGSWWWYERAVRRLKQGVA